MIRLHRNNQAKGLRPSRRKGVIAALRPSRSSGTARIAPGSGHWLRTKLRSPTPPGLAEGLHQFLSAPDSSPSD